MKRLGKLVVFILFLSIGTSFAYTPNQQDNNLISAFQNKISNILTTNNSKNIIIADQVKTIKNRYNNNERIFHIFGEIEQFIRYFGQENTETESENTTEIIIETLCQQNIKSYMTNNISNYSYGEPIFVASEQELRDAINTAKNTTTQNYIHDIVIKKGTYTLSNGFRIDTNNLIIRGETGNPNDVILQGQGMKGGVSHIFWIIGDNINIGDMRIGNVANHAIQIHGERDADNTRIHNIEIFDTNEQMIKGSAGQDRTHSSDGAIVQCSTFEYTANIGPQYYIGGIDIHFGKDRIVRNNTFYNITSPETALAEHAIHFRSDSIGTLVEYNKIINCDRGIGFGLGSSQHLGGTIRFNEIYHDNSKGDVGIGLESAANVEIYSNIIFFENNYANAIEYRFPIAQNNNIYNNKTNKNIQKRNDGQANLYDNIIITSNPISY